MFEVEHATHVNNKLYKREYKVAYIILTRQRCVNLFMLQKMLWNNPSIHIFYEYMLL